MMTTAHALESQPVETSAPPVTVRNLLVLATFLLTFHVPSWQSQENQSTADLTVDTHELPRFHEVHPYFLRGAAPTYGGLQQLKKLGVKTVIDLRHSQDRIDIERTYCQLLGMTYVSLPLGNFVPSLNKQKEFLHIMDDAVANPSHGPVFLHCSHGSDRTGFLTALWRVEHDHWSIIQAAGEMVQYGFFIHKFDANDRK